MDDIKSLEDVRYFPIDFDAVKKGDSWTPEELERLTEYSRESPHYAFAVLALKSMIVRECRDRNKNFTVAVVKGCLRVLTDEEAAEYNHQMVRSGIRRSVRSFRRLTHVDVANLSISQKCEHDRRVIVYGRMLQAANSERHKAIRATMNDQQIKRLPTTQEQSPPPPPPDI